MATWSPSELLDWLGQNQFLAPPQADELRPLLVSFSDCHSLAKELIRRDWLTPYQVNQILQGRHDQLILGNYRVRERLGEGAMGQVFKAWNLRTLRVVAVKTILKELVKSPKTMERFRREIEAASQLEHPNIAHVRDADEADGQLFLVMEFIEGSNLSQRVKQDGPLPIAEAVEYARQAALGLQHAFEKGIVHRDIKPANLIVTTLKVNGDALPVVKILDFGLARFDSESEEAARLTQVGKLLGTIDYIAPEQAQNARDADIRADIYSLGCSLHYLLTAQPPFAGDTMVEKLSQRVTGEPPWIREIRPEVPPLLEQVLRKMMARRPEDRFQTPIKVVQALASLTLAPSGAALATPVAVAASAGVALALPVAATGESVAMALPVGDGCASASSLELPQDPVLHGTAPVEQPEFLAMSATGRDSTTGKTPPAPRPIPQPKRGFPITLIVTLGSAAFGVTALGCLGCLLMFWPSTEKKKGSIVITNQTKFANPNNVAKPGTNRVLVFIRRIDFNGPVTVTLKDLPDGVTVANATIPAKSDRIDLAFTVSHGTQPQVKQIRLVAMYEPDDISEEMPLTLTIIEDPANKLKK
jgi:tRNA A-37 threonylcarbamoyl transferase component Bud32